jgi:hypothetical protein
MDSNTMLISQIGNETSDYNRRKFVLRGLVLVDASRYLAE